MPRTQITLMNYIRQSLFRFCLCHWKQYIPVRCETPTDRSTDRFPFFFFVCLFHPVQTKRPCHSEGWETPQLPQNNTWQLDTHMSEPQYADCLSHSLRNLLACQLWKTWERSSARVHPALNILLAAHTIGEQSRYYFITIPVKSGMHCLICKQVNDSV